MVECLFFPAEHFLYDEQTNMADELKKYKQILEKEDEEFRRAMEAEVSTLLFPRFSCKCRILAG